MRELSGFMPTPRARNRTVLIVRVAEAQFGVISRLQLVQCGMSRGTISRWIADGRLHRIHPRVYALGHRRLALEGRLVAALLYAGPGAALSHATAAWWWQLIEHQPTRIDVSAPGHARSLPAVQVHHPRRLEPTRHRRLPVTTVAQTLLDHAAAAPPDRVRRALAEADYRGLLDVEVVEAVLGQGHPGSSRLRGGLTVHRPELALTRSVLEQSFISFCESSQIPPPEINATIEGLTVDALWRKQRVIVELDGEAAHSSRAQIERDHQRDLILRAAGYIVLRYTWRQVTRHPTAVATDLNATLLSRS